MVNLEYNYSSLPLQKATARNVIRPYYFSDSIGRTLTRMALLDEVREWCMENLGYIPLVKSNRNRRRRTNDNWLRFANQQDRCLFQIRYGV